MIMKQKPLKHLQQMKKTENKKINRRSKKIIVIAITLLIAIIAVTAGITQYQMKKNEEEVRIRKQQERAEEEEKQRRREYSEKLQLVIGNMLSGAADAEDCCNLIRRVWSNAIYERDNDETDKYTKVKGSFVTDFNDALDNLYGDLDFQTKISDIKENQETVIYIMKELQNPQEEYKTAYKFLVQCYDAYLTFTNMAINPNGSLNTFSDDFDDADTEFLHCYDTMKIYLPDTK
ncbi:MAG: hypothetical protein HFG31_07935 [Eubacterium sp.]|nr:hypothetical protein [Eubacterium sp.]